MAIISRVAVVCSQLPSWYRWMNEFSLISREQVIELFGFSDSSEVDVNKGVLVEVVVELTLVGIGDMDGVVRSKKPYYNLVIAIDYAHLTRCEE